MKMVAKCEQCEATLIQSVKTEHAEVLGGMHIILSNCVNVLRCPDHEEVSFTEIPDLEGLRMAVAVARIMLPEKLNGEEIRFLRRALGWKSKQLADELKISEEVVSRWEHGKLAIGPSIEKLLRLTVGFELGDKAPCVEFDAKKIPSLELVSVRAAGKPLHLWFQRMPVVKRSELEQRTETRWLATEERAAMS